MMKIKVMMLAGAFALVAPMFTQAGDLWPARDPGGVSPAELERGAAILRDTPKEFFRAQEFSVDLFGTVGVAELDSVEDLNDHEAGAGLGVNYFFSRNVGVGFELRGKASTIRSDWLNEAGLHVTYRLPIGTVAPYGFAGGGYTIVDHRLEFDTYAGVGAEVRLAPTVGVFSDLRRFLTGEREGEYLGRMGLRLSF